MQARQIIPLLLAFANEMESVGGRTRFQKMIFVLQTKANFFKIKYEFMAHDYGPYSQELQTDIDELINSGYLREERKKIERGKIRYQYTITTKGAEIITSILDDNQLNKKFSFRKLRNSCEQVKKNLNHMDLSSLLGAIYSMYPQYANIVNSNSILVESNDLFVAQEKIYFRNFIRH